MLFEYNINNTLYVCFASEFFKTEKTIEDDELLIKLYFKSLYSKNINSAKDFFMQKFALIKKLFLQFRSY